METVRLQTAVNSLLECSFCLDVYEDPRILSCGHTFCLKCLQKQCESFNLTSKNNEPTCGICRKQWKIPEQGINSLPKNFVVQSCSMVFPSLNKCSIADDDSEHGKVEYFCIDCWDPFCVSCKDVHRKTKFTKSHILKSITEISKEDIDKYRKQVALMCSQHKNQELTLFCTNCKEIGCSTCIIKSHSKHDCTDLIEADKNFIKEIYSWLDVLRKKEEELQSQIKDANKSMTSLYFGHAFSIISTKYFIDDIKKTLLSLFEIVLLELERCKQKTLLVMTEKTNEENSRFQKYLATKEETLKKLQSRIVLHENNLPPFSSVNERLQFTKGQKKIADDEFREQDLTSSDNMTYDLVDVTQWRRDIVNWMQPIKSVLIAAVNLPHVETDREKKEVSIRDECRMSACEQRREKYTVSSNDECLVLPSDKGSVSTLDNSTVPTSEEFLTSVPVMCTVYDQEKYAISKFEDKAAITTEMYVYLQCAKVVIYVIIILITAAHVCTSTQNWRTLLHI